MAESAYKVAIQTVASVNNVLAHDVVDTYHLAMHVQQMTTV